MPFSGSSLVLLALGALVLEARADCAIDKSYIRKNHPMFLVDGGHAHYELLLRDAVPSASRFHLLCDGLLAANLNCSKTNAFEPPLPQTRCSLPKAEVRPLSPLPGQPSHVRRYSVRYTLGGDATADLYTTAYDEQELRALYTVHRSFAGNAAMGRPQQTFTTDGLMSSQEAQSFKKEEVFNRITQLLGAQQKFVPGSTASVIERGHLAPSGDFIFDQDMRATFKYLNVVPQFGEINRGNWEAIERWVRQRPSDGHIEFRAVTGGLGVLSLPHSTTKKPVDIYLLPNKRNPVPEWMFKVIEKQGRCTAFIVYNNIYAKSSPKEICRRVKCPTDVALSDDMTKGYTYCCDASEFMKKFLSHEDHLPKC